MKQSKVIIALLSTITVLLIVAVFWQNSKLNTLNESLNTIETNNNASNKELNNQIDVLQNEKEQLLRELETVKAKNKELESELANNDNNDNDNIETKSEINFLDYASMQELKMKGISDINIIIEDLKQNTELIPQEGVLGGNMIFTDVYLLNYKWAYCIYEDGHIQGSALFKYEIDNEKNISWQLIDSFVFGE